MSVAPEEIWKAIEGYEGCYEVSNLGRVRSLPRTVFWTRITEDEKTYYMERKVEGGIIAINILKDDHPYCYVILCKNGKHESLYVHRLVAKAFLPNPHNLPQVDHLDNKKHNNAVSNLEWVSARENLLRAPLRKTNKTGERHIQITKDKRFRSVITDPRTGKIVRKVCATLEEAKTFKQSILSPPIRKDGDVD